MASGEKRGKNPKKRPSGRPFKKGCKPGPGRPKGSISLRQQIRAGIRDGDMTAIVRRLVAEARRGGVRAAELLLRHALGINPQPLDAVAEADDRDAWLEIDVADAGGKPLPLAFGTNIDLGLLHHLTMAVSNAFEAYMAAHPDAETGSRPADQGEDLDPTGCDPAETPALSRKES